MMAKKREGRGVSANRTHQTELFCCVQKERERERERERKNGCSEPPTDV